MVAMDPHTGRVLAMVGGYDYDKSEFNRAVDALRQPGSAFKPFVYCAALANGYSPCDKLVDRPITVHYQEDGRKKVWSPRNADRVFTGDSMTLRYAMARSVNTVTAQLTILVRPDTVANVAYRCGIKSPLKPVPSVGLGANDVSLFELVASYATFMNQGMYTKPSFIQRIEDKHGKVLYQHRPQKRRAISKQTAYLMTYMLRGGVEEPGGTAQGLFAYDLFKRNQLGGKTGTSTGNADGWFIGLSKDLIGGVWVGAEDKSVRFRTGRLGEGMRTALPIFGEFLEDVYKVPDIGVKRGYFPRPKLRISVPYDCPTKYEVKDSVLIDSLISLQSHDSLLSSHDSLQIDSSQINAQEIKDSILDLYLD